MNGKGLDIRQNVVTELESAYRERMREGKVTPEDILRVIIGVAFERGYEARP